MSISITNLTSKDIEKVLKKILSENEILLTIKDPDIDESYEGSKFINDASINVVIDKTERPTSWDQRVLKLARNSKLSSVCNTIDEMHNAGWLTMIIEMVKYYANKSEFRVNWLAVTWVLWKYEVLKYNNYRLIYSKAELDKVLEEYKENN